MKNIIDDLKKGYIHPNDIVDYLLQLYSKNNRDLFEQTCNAITVEQVGHVLLQADEGLLSDMLSVLSDDRVADGIDCLESDDATDLIIDIENISYDRSVVITNKISQKNRKTILKLKQYDDDEAGALMKTEFFSVSLDEKIANSLKRLKVLKKSGYTDSISNVYILDHNNKLVAIMNIANLILEHFEQSYKDVLSRSITAPVTVKDTDAVGSVVKVFDRFGFLIIPVVSSDGTMLGIITSDNIYDIVNDSATEQIYHLAAVGEDEDTFIKAFRSRGFWLFINLLTAVLTSIILGFYKDTLEAYIPLAVLLPIIGSMGGNAVTQSLAVTVRQLTLREIHANLAKKAIYREILLGLMNGLLFGIITGIISYMLYSNILLGEIMFLSMLINMFLAGFFGAAIPMLLKRLKLDPAIGSTVILTTITDIVGFVTFLILARVLIV